MLSLIIKDILVQKKKVLFGIIYIPFVIIVFQNIGLAMFAAAMTGFTYMLLMTSCAYEDVNKADIMVNSLPVSRSKVVAAKYLSILMYFVFGTIVYIIVTGVMGILKLPFNIFPVTLSGFIGGFASITMLSCIYLPLFFKVGYIKSKALNFILFFGFFFGFSALLEMLQKDAGRVMSENFINTLKNMGDAAIVLLVAVIIGIFISVSFWLSVRFYKNREF